MSGTIKLSNLPESSELDKLYALGVNKDGESVRFPLGDKLKEQGDAIAANNEAVEVMQENPNRIISYTSTDNNVVVPFSTSVFGATLVSNTYKNGRGTMLFNAPVTKIGDSAFANSHNLKSIVVPENVKSIGKNAFDGCTMLTKISLPDGLTSIGNNAFYYCGIKSIVIPDSVTSLGTGLFNFSDLTESQSQATAEGKPIDNRF